MDAFLGSWKAVLDSDEAKAEFRAYIAAETAGGNEPLPLLQDVPAVLELI